MVFFEPYEKPPELSLFTCFEHVCDEAGNGEEAYAFSLGARCMAESGSYMGFAGTRITYQQYVLFVLYVFAVGEFEYKFSIDAGLGGEIKGIERLDDGKLSGLEPSLGGALFSVKEFPFGEPHEIRGIVGVLFAACGGYGRVFAQHGRHLKLFEVMFEQYVGTCGAHQFSPPRSCWYTWRSGG